MGQAIFTEVCQEVLSETVMWEQRAVRGKSWNIQEKRAKAKRAAHRCPEVKASQLFS